MPRTACSTTLARHSTFDGRGDGAKARLIYELRLKKFALRFCARALASFLGLKPLL